MRAPVIAIRADCYGFSGCHDSAASERSLWFAISPRVTYGSKGKVRNPARQQVDLLANALARWRTADE